MPSEEVGSELLDMVSTGPVARGHTGEQGPGCGLLLRAVGSHRQLFKEVNGLSDLRLKKNPDCYVRELEGQEQVREVRCNVLMVER